MRQPDLRGGARAPKGVGGPPPLPPNVFPHAPAGSRVPAGDSGTATVKDATSEAIRDWVTKRWRAPLHLGSVAGPTPYRCWLRDFHRRFDRPRNQAGSGAEGFSVAGLMLLLAALGWRLQCDWRLFHPFCDGTLRALIWCGRLRMRGGHGAHAARLNTEGPRRRAATGT